MTDPAVRKARLQLEKLRRCRQNAEEAGRELVTVYKEQQLSAINEEMKSVDSAVPEKEEQRSLDSDQHPDG